MRLKIVLLLAAVLCIPCLRAAPPAGAHQTTAGTAKGGGSANAPKTSNSNDQRLQREVQRLLQDDPTTRSFASSAVVQSGVVTLTGRTYHPEAKATAQRLVQGLPGIKAVRNGIQVEPSTDLAIAQRLHEEFSRDPGIHDAAIAVTVIDGRVFLSGTADSADEVTRITRMALDIPGVRTVSNGLEVSPVTASRGGSGRSPSQPYGRYQPRPR